MTVSNKTNTTKTIPCQLSLGQVVVDDDDDDDDDDDNDDDDDDAHKLAKVKLGECKGD